MLRRLIPAVCGLVILAALTAIRFADPYPVEAARQIALDSLQRLSPRAAADFPVRVVDIDDASLAEHGQWPWPRDLLARLTERLAELGAAAIAYDMLFAEPDRTSPSRVAAALPGVGNLADHDLDFARALAATPSVLGFAYAPSGAPSPAAKAGFAVSGLDPSASIPPIPAATVPFAPLAEAAPGLGAISLNTGDQVNAVRRLPLVWRGEQGLVPTLSLEALRLALGASTYVVFGETGAEGFVESIRLGEFTIPTTPQGDLTLYYRRPDPALYVSARDVLGDGYEALADRIGGQIVLIGTSASGLGDLRGTPLGDTVPGVSIHAQAIEQIVSQTFLRRTDWISGLEIAAFVGLGAALAAAVLAAGPLVGLLAGATASAAAIAFCWVMFTRHGLLVDPSFLLIGGFVLYSAMIFVRFVTTDAERRKVRRAFGHYVSPEVLGEIERRGDALELGGEVRPLTVMFADIRDFTSISETMTPGRLVTMLNTLFGALGDEIVRERGTIDKFIGDAIMAFWNAPVDVPDHPLRACRAALGMRARLRALNAADSLNLGGDAKGRKLLRIGIGISTGEALVGNLGLETRFDYSCVGDTVNLASRVEGACKLVGYDAVVSQSTRDGAPALAFLEAGALLLKGKSAPSPIYLLVGDETLAASPAFTALAEAHEEVLGGLRNGHAVPEAVARCLALCAAVDANLVPFYDLLEIRRADFLPAARVREEQGHG